MGKQGLPVVREGNDGPCFHEIIVGARRGGLNLPVRGEMDAFLPLELIESGRMWRFLAKAAHGLARL